MSSTEFYTLSLHDALPIYAARLRIGRLGDAPEGRGGVSANRARRLADQGDLRGAAVAEDRKSTRLNSSHMSISYAVFCLKKKNMVIGIILTLSLSLSKHLV